MAESAAEEESAQVLGDVVEDAPSNALPEVTEEDAAAAGEHAADAAAQLAEGEAEPVPAHEEGQEDGAPAQEGAEQQQQESSPGGEAEAEAGAEAGEDPAAEQTAAEGDSPAAEEAEGDAQAAEEEQPAAEPEPEPEPEPAAPPPPPPPAYVPPEVGDDYILVAKLPPLPEPFARNEEGKKTPLPGIESMFLTGTTVELLGMSHLGKDKEGSQLLDTVAKEKILHDIQFRGAISDFYVIKAKVIEADYDPLLIKINEDDTYGDGNNFELVLRKEAGDVWTFIEDEIARRKQLQVDEELRAAIEKSKPRSQKKRIPKPWISRGSEQEIDEANVKSRREPIHMVVQRRRRDFNQAFKLADKDAHELWNSSQMECRPFKDPNFDLRKMEQDSGVQAVPAMVGIAVQASGNRPRPNSTQYAAEDLPEAAKAELRGGTPLARFLECVMFQCEEALIQNEVTNIFQDDFATLAEEDAVSGNRKEAIITEYQSFTHLTFSKNKVVSAVQWLPHRKGVVAVACTEALSFTERVSRAGRPSHAYILIWNFKDPIHPEYVLQAPFEVFAFQFNPLNPDIIAAGCYNGQVVLWDMSHETEHIASVRSTSKQDGVAGGGGGGDAGDEAQIPVVKWRFASAVEFSHNFVVTDLQWLPGIDATRGRFSKLGEGSKECSFFATTSGDGKVNFWDTRVERLLKKGRKTDADMLDLVWKPVHSVHLISLLGMDLGSTRFCFNAGQLERGLFSIASFDGELVHGQYVKPEGDENPECTKSINQAHVGPIVALERSPFFEDILLSVGDWSFQIWREGELSPLFQSGYAADYYTAGCWSPTRAAVVYLTDNSGNLEVWDVLDRSHEYSIRVTLSSSPFMSMAFMAGASTAAANQSQFLALGDSSGVLRIVELPRNLRRPVPNEKKLMTAFLDREADRVRDVGARLPARALALKAAEESKKAQEDAEAAAAAARDSQAKDQGGLPTPKHAATKVHEIDEKAEAEYYKLEQAFKIKLGLVDEEGK